MPKLIDKEKDKDKETGLSNFGVRNYDDGLGRFMSVDVLWEKYRAWSPYVYSMNNPMTIKDPSGRSGEATIDHDEKTIVVRSHFIFYGGAANSSIAKKLTDKISEKWNAMGTVKLDGKAYKIKFDITYEVKGRDEALADAATNGTNAVNNFIRLENDLGTGIGTSNMDGNSGAWQAIDYELPDGSVDYTSAHEYIHGLGIYKHSYWDSNSGEVPDIGVGAESVPSGMVIDPVVKQKNFIHIFNVNNVRAKDSGKETVNWGKVNNAIR